MSYTEIERVRTLSKTKQSQRLLLMALAHRADRRGVCWPGIDTLAADINTIPRNAAELVRKLKQTGEVLVFQGGGRAKSNVYLITLGRSQEEIAQIIASHRSINPVDSGINPVDSDRVLESINPVDSGINPVDSGINPVDSDRGIERNIKGTEINHDVVVAADEIFNSPELPELPDPRPELTEITKLFAGNICSINGIIAGDMEDIYNGLSPPAGETKYGWFEYAILAAAGNRKTTWSYVKAIINKIDQAGSLAEHKEKWNGHIGRKQEISTGQSGGQSQRSGGARSGNRPASPPAGSYAAEYRKTNEANIDDFERKMFG